MRKIINIIIALALLLLNVTCKAQNEVKTHLSSMENFNIKRFEKQSINGTANFQENGYIYRQFGDTTSGYVEIITLEEPEVFEVYAEYYTDGKLKTKGLHYPNEFKKGIWKEYDQKGNLVNEIDHDKAFSYSFEQVLDWVKKEKIDTTTNKFGIFRSTDEESTIWEVNWLGKSGNTIEFMIIDGATGKVVEKGSREYKNS